MYRPRADFNLNKTQIYIIIVLPMCTIAIFIILKINNKRIR